MTDGKFDSLGECIDIPQEDFEKFIINSKVPIGEVSNLILLLESSYEDLRNRKDAIISGRTTENIPGKDLHNLVRQIYAELFKIEQKVVFLKSRFKGLLQC